MLKEILTKAVVSKGKISDEKEIVLEVEKDVSKVIGCWVINHNYLSVVENNKVYASGCYDVHVWYALKDNTDTLLLKKTIDYKEEFVMDNSFDFLNSEYKVYCLEYPNCSGLKLVENKIVVGVKKALALDVIGESKLLVQVSDNSSREEDISINPNYMGR